jgi:hypothetical protein
MDALTAISISVSPPRPRQAQFHGQGRHHANLGLDCPHGKEASEIASEASSVRQVDSSQLSPSPEAMVRAVIPAWHVINPWVPVVLKVKEMPQKGNATPYLCSEMRAVLNQAGLMVSEYSREKTELLEDIIYGKGLGTQIKLDDNKTTLGIVFTDDMVETVLPGAPAFLAGLRKGDRIQKVRTAPTRCNLQPWASSAMCSASAPVLRPLALSSRR